MFHKLEHHFVRCSTCGLERIDPQPTNETLAKIYGAHYYDAWGLRENEALVATLKKRTFRSVLDRLGTPPPRAKLVDCGAATGFLLEVAAELGYEPYGLEFSEFGAREIARKFGDDRVFCGELENVAFPGVAPGAFHAVTMCDFIEHVRDPRQTLKLARALIRPGGVLAITTPDAGSPSRRVLGNGWSHYKVEHLHYFNKRNLGRLLKEVGFSSVSFFPLWKTLSLEYIGHQFEIYPHPALTPLARALMRITPAMIRTMPLPFTTGELLAVART